MEKRRMKLGRRKKKGRPKQKKRRGRTHGEKR
jgi:hypothetical protein